MQKICKNQKKIAFYLLKFGEDMKQNTATTAAPLTIAEAAKMVAAAGICAERTARDWLYTKRVPLTYLQTTGRGRIFLHPAEVQKWIETAAKRKGGKNGN